jgi:hypothetical protein
MTAALRTQAAAARRGTKNNQLTGTLPSELGAIAAVEFL